MAIGRPAPPQSGLVSEAFVNFLARYAASRPFDGRQRSLQQKTPEHTPIHSVGLWPSFCGLSHALFAIRANASGCP
jgi:hypothetical protein